MKTRVRLLFIVGTASLMFASLGAQDWRHGQPPQSERSAGHYVPDLAPLTAAQSSELRELVDRYVADLAALRRFYSVPNSTLQITRFKAFNEAWLVRLDAVDFESLGVEGRIDWHLLRAHLRHDTGLLERAAARNAEMAGLLPFADSLARLQESRRQFEPIKPSETAAALDQLTKEIAALRKALESEGAKPGKIVALRAAGQLEDLGKAFKDWFEYANGYDPQFGWWNREPYKDATAAIEDYRKFLREKIVGVKAGEDEPIVGDPIGAAGLAGDLEREMISYTPAELIAIAEREFSWCEAEWKKVAGEMGLGEDWMAALERTKQDFVAPGDQPALIAEQAYEAIDFLLQRDLITIPTHAIDTWRMAMMSPERQKVAPFFLGGEQILVSFPTDAMDQADKLDSLRANNRHFCRAVVHHELIPGHHLQGWYNQRSNPHRRLFYTPFWGEGWALWWEFRLWDLGFAQSPENKAGMLFWRTHRAARIIFSLNFHLGKWTPEQCINFLVERVGHDRHTATGEVRRSFNGDYSPLYQVGYMMGAIQIRALYDELVRNGKMPEKEFHDRILRGNTMPIELVRAHLTNTKLPRDYQSSWKFAGEKP
ncbi:MAG: DUF885 family protein [Candidatus Didemnitutus sp.]|nr:DUF885 family protein [Candidatus Didemnitutus sp.]